MCNSDFLYFLRYKGGHHYTADCVQNMGLKVLCTVAVVLANGYKDVRRLEGYEQRQVADYLLVQFRPEDFEDVVDIGEPSTRWVKENDCLYFDNAERRADGDAKLEDLHRQWADQYEKLRQDRFRRLIQTNKWRKEVQKFRQTHKACKPLTTDCGWNK
jgi:hypothetical protein